MNKLLPLMFLFVAFGLSAQENYKTLHPVSEYKNPSLHKLADIQRPVRFSERPKNIILLIGDGMGLAHLYAGYTANKGTLNIFQMPFTGFSITYSQSSYITDSGAGATAIACGTKTFNGAIGVDANSKPVTSILERAEAKSLSTGLVSTSAITHATPASFIAHVSDRASYEDIALEFLKTDIDVVIGGGLDHFNKRADGRVLCDELKAKGYNMAYNMDDAMKLPAKKMVALTAPLHNGKVDERGNMLPMATEKAIDVLSKNKRGFFLMVEGSQIDWGAHQNDVEYVISETLDFDQAVGKALDFASKDKNTLVIVTADHETGGLAIVGGNIADGQVKASFNTTNHTAVMVPVFAYGPGAQLFTGVYQNTDIFTKMMELLMLSAVVPVK
jgi:alkaline phosphatase